MLVVLVATKTALTTVKNKIPHVSELATKVVLTAAENKIPDVNNFATKTALNNLSYTVPDITTLIKKSDYDTKIADIEKKYVNNSGFTPKLREANVITKRNFDAKIIELEISNTDYVSSWKSKGLSTETIKPPATSDNSLTPALSYYNNRVTVKFIGSCLKQPILRYHHKI